MLARSNHTTSRSHRATKQTILPVVTHLTETKQGSNIFTCLVPSRSFAGVVYKLHVRATWYPYEATCQCPGSRGNCAHKAAAIAAVEVFRAERWQAHQQHRDERYGPQPLTWQLGAESLMQEGAQFA